MCSISYHLLSSLYVWLPYRRCIQADSPQIVYITGLSVVAYNRHYLGEIAIRRKSQKVCRIDIDLVSA